jgi:hypothetical protein
VFAKACLHEATFRDADLGGDSADFGGALFCETVRLPLPVRKERRDQGGRATRLPLLAGTVGLFEP